LSLLAFGCTNPDPDEPAFPPASDAVDGFDGDGSQSTDGAGGTDGAPSQGENSADPDDPDDGDDAQDGVPSDGDADGGTDDDGDTGDGGDSGGDDPDGSDRGEDSAWLRQDGLRILNGDDEAVTLRGINLGGWLMWEAWLWGGFGTPTVVNSETYLMRRLSDEVGEEAAETFRQEIYDTYITEADIARIAAVGYNMVRVPINHRAIEDPVRPGSLDKTGIARIDRLIDWGERHGVYIILDLHSAPGGQSDLFTADPDDTNLWDSQANQDRTVVLWRALAQRYADEPWVAGYDLLNEPATFQPVELTDLYNRIITAVREVDTRHIVFVEGNFGAHILTDLGDRIIDDDNLVYSFHAYSFVGRDLEEDFAAHLAFAREHNRPLYAGEYGHGELEEARYWTSRYAETPEVVAWSPWTWKRAAIDDTLAPVEIPIPDSWRRVIAAITTGLPISLFDVEAAMAEFLQAVRLENGTEQQAYVAATT
jgi:hypothetical protein